MTDTKPSVAVLEAVAERDETDITELPPLDDVLDPDGLDIVFGPKADGTPRSGGEITFTYAGYLITVRAVAQGKEVIVESAG